MGLYIELTKCEGTSRDITQVGAPIKTKKEQNIYIFFQKSFG